MACSYREAEELRSIYKEHTYWADLSFNERVAFVRKQQSEESSRERSHIWSDFKEDRKGLKLKSANAAFDANLNASSPSVHQVLEYLRVGWHWHVQ